MTSAEPKLLEKARAGNREAFAELVSLYKDRLYSIASSVCASRPSEADDVAQETFIAALKNISTFRANAAFSTWLYRIAANNCWQRLRRETGARRAELPDEHSKGHPAMSSAASSAAKNELARAVSDALGELPAPYRMAVTLCDIEGLSAAESAAKMKISVPALKSRLHRGRLLLKKQLSVFR